MQCDKKNKFLPQLFFSAELCILESEIRFDTNPSKTEGKMAEFYKCLDDKLTRFIEEQKIFFVATAARDGRVSLSPKGYDSLKVLGSNRLVWLNLSGSGNETAAHLKLVNRMTLMFCSFSGPPRILRLYGQATTVHPRDASWETLCSHFEHFKGARQFFDMQIESVQTSCGFGVPLFDFVGQRDTLLKNADKYTPEQQAERWAVNNVESIDGFPTGIFGD